MAVQNVQLFVFLFVFFLLSAGLFPFLLSGGMGRRRSRDTSTITAQAGPGVGNGYTGGKGCCFLLARGSGMLPQPWPFGPHVAGYQITDSNKKQFSSATAAAHSPLYPSSTPLCLSPHSTADQRATIRPHSSYRFLGSEVVHYVRPSSDSSRLA